MSTTLLQNTTKFGFVLVYTTKKKLKSVNVEFQIKVGY
jgi:hypothetical protein